MSSFYSPLEGRALLVASASTLSHVADELHGNTEVALLSTPRCTVEASHLLVARDTQWDEVADIFITQSVVRQMVYVQNALRLATSIASLAIESKDLFALLLPLIGFDIRFVERCHIPQL